MMFTYRLCRSVVGTACWSRHSGAKQPVAIIIRVLVSQSVDPPVLDGLKVMLPISRCTVPDPHLKTHGSESDSESQAGTSAYTMRVYGVPLAVVSYDVTTASAHFDLLYSRGRLSCSNSWSPRGLVKRLRQCPEDVDFLSGLRPCRLQAPASAEAARSRK